MITGVLFVLEGVNNDWQTGIENIVKLENERVEDCLATELVVKGEPELRHDIDHVFVEIVDDEFSVFPVTLSSVIEHQLAKMFKLSDRVVTRPCCLVTLYSLDPHSTVGCCYHVHIVGSIPYG